LAASQLVTSPTRHTVNSSQSSRHNPTSSQGQLVIKPTRHMVNSSQFINNNDNHFTDLCPGLPGWAGTI